MLRVFRVVVFREPSPLPASHHPQTIGRVPELAGKPVLVLGNKVDLPGAVQDPVVLSAALYLPVVGPEGGVGTWGGPLAVRMCSGVRGEGYVEGAFSRSRPVCTICCCLSFVTSTALGIQCWGPILHLPACVSLPLRGAAFRWLAGKLQ